MEFKGTKGIWREEWRNSDLVEIRSEDHLNKPICELDSYYFSNRVTGFDELRANALLISKAPEYHADCLKDLDLYNEILMQLPLGLEHLVYAIKERKKEKEQLIKEATKI